MKVTKIEVQKKNKQRVSVFCDEEYAFSLNAETLIKNAVSVGAQLSETQIKNMVFESDYLSAVNQASVYVSKGLKTKKQIETYLSKKGYNFEIITQAIKKLEEYNLLNDFAFIKAFVADHSAYGELKLKQELALKGVEKDLIEEYFSNNYEVNIEKLKSLKDKYLKNKEPTPENIIKCKKHLLSKGFKYEDITALDWSENESWNWYCWS